MSVTKNTALKPGWRALPYTSPKELRQAFADGVKFVLHYHGRQYEVTNMSAHDKVVFVQPPGLPVKIFPDGRNCESAGDAIWLEQVAAQPLAEAPDGFALVPLRMTQAMRDVTDSDGWTWADLLAAAESITEEQHATLAATPAQPPADYSNEWLLNKARQSKELLDAVPAPLQETFVQASATLPAEPVSLSKQYAREQLAKQMAPVYKAFEDERPVLQGELHLLRQCIDQMSAAQCSCGAS